MAVKKKSEIKKKVVKKQVLSQKNKVKHLQKNQNLKKHGKNIILH